MGMFSCYLYNRFTLRSDYFLMVVIPYFIVSEQVPNGTSMDEQNRLTGEEHTQGNAVIRQL